MSLRFPILLAAITCFQASRAPAQASAAPDPAGTWRGTSLCLVRPSPCNDEVVVYYIKRIRGDDSLTIDARKIVAGKEEEMGVIACRFTAANAELRCPLPTATWIFTIRHDSLIGELRRSDGTRFRDVRTARSR